MQVLREKTCSQKYPFKYNIQLNVVIKNFYIHFILFWLKARAFVY